MTANNTEKKITKSMRFEDIKALLTGNVPQNGTTVDVALAVIDHELEILSKKNSKKSEGNSENQEKDEVLKLAIYDFLMQKENGATCTEIMKTVPEFSDSSNQKVAKLVNAMLADGKVNRNKGKGGAILYSIA